jgi:hypothetical protein
LTSAIRNGILCHMSKIADVIRAEIVRLSAELEAAKRALRAIEPNREDASPKVTKRASTKSAPKRAVSEETRAKMRASHAARKLKLAELNGASQAPEASDGTA